VELGNEWHGQSWRAVAAPSLGILVDQFTASAAVDAAPDRERRGEQVDVLALQRQCF
jgi:hypothetical protein